MKKLSVIFFLMLTACMTPEQAQRMQAMGAAMQQAGQPSAYPTSTLQGINAGFAGYNGMPLDQNPYAYTYQPQQEPSNCIVHKTGIWQNTRCY